MINSPQYPNNYTTPDACNVTFEIAIQQLFVVQLFQNVIECSVPYQISKELFYHQFDNCEATKAGYQHSKVILYKKESNENKNLKIILHAGTGDAFNFRLTGNIIFDISSSKISCQCY